MWIVLISPFLQKVAKPAQMSLSLSLQKPIGYKDIYIFPTSHDFVSLSLTSHLSLNLPSRSPFLLVNEFSKLFCEIELKHFLNSSQVMDEVCISSMFTLNFI